MKISVLIPMFNEISRAADTAKKLSAAMSALSAETGDTFEIIFSDDGSADGSRAAIEGLIGELPGLRLVTSDVNRGKGAALRRAALASDGDVVIFTDCDLAYGTDVIGEAIGTLRSTGADVLIGSRAIHPQGYEGYTALRRVASKTYMRILARTAGFSLTDCQCGFKGFRGDLCRELFGKLETDRWSFDFELLMRAKKKGAAIVEMPVKVLIHGESKIHLLKDSLTMLRDVRRMKKRLDRQA